MVNWIAKIKTGDLHKAYKAGRYDIQTVAAGYVQRLRDVPPGIIDHELREIINNLEDVDDVNEFDYILDELYDWGDSGHRLWIDTF